MIKMVTIKYLIKNISFKFHKYRIYQVIAFDHYTGIGDPINNDIEFLGRFLHYEYNRDGLFAVFGSVNYLGHKYEGYRHKVFIKAIKEVYVLKRKQKAKKSQITLCNNSLIGFFPFTSSYKVENALIKGNTINLASFHLKEDKDS